MSEHITYEGSSWKAIDFLDHIGLSIHIFIHPDGKVEPMVPTTEKALHAGKSKHNGLTGLNNHFLGFELLVQGNNNYSEFLDKIEKPETYTDQQFNSAVLLTRVWMEAYNISSRNVVRHSDVSGDDERGKGNGKKDPGKGFNWNEFLKRIKQ